MGFSLPEQTVQCNNYVADISQLQLIFSHLSAIFSRFFRCECCSTSWDWRMFYAHTGVSVQCSVCFFFGGGTRWKHCLSLLFHSQKRNMRRNKQITRDGNNIRCLHWRVLVWGVYATLVQKHFHYSTSGEKYHRHWTRMKFFLVRMCRPPVFTHTLKGCVRLCTYAKSSRQNWRQYNESANTLKHPLCQMPKNASQVGSSIGSGTEPSSCSYIKPPAWCSRFLAVTLLCLTKNTGILSVGAFVFTSLDCLPL